VPFFITGRIFAENWLENLEKELATLIFSISAYTFTWSAGAKQTSFSEN
jgi:hypothetical protein